MKRVILAAVLVLACFVFAIAQAPKGGPAVSSGVSIPGFLAGAGTLTGPATSGTAAILGANAFTAAQTITTPGASGYETGLTIANPNTSSYSTVLLSLNAGGYPLAQMIAQEYGTAATGMLIFDVNSGGTLHERARFDQAGHFGINNNSPHSFLAVTGLTVYANNAAAITGGLAAGDFYRTGSDPDMVAVVH
jgi:hypothetical protein